MDSTALKKFNDALTGGRVLQSFAGNVTSIPNIDQKLVDQTLWKAAVAQAVGCWEGYIEAVLPEFVSKTRVNANRRAWTLIVQFESLVKKMTEDLNTPAYDKCRELITAITGMDPYPSWIWAPKFANQVDTKSFFKGVMDVRHSFAHGFSVPSNVPGILIPGELDNAYVTDAIDCLTFFAVKTDYLLEHELTHRHSCAAGWG